MVGIGLTVAFAIAVLACTSGNAIVGAVKDYKDSKANERYIMSKEQIQSTLKSQSFSNYLNDARALGYVDNKTYGKAISSYNKVKNGIELTREDHNNLAEMYNSLYANDQTFRENWDNKYRSLSNEDKLKWLDGASGGSVAATIPGPAYLDTSFETYQREVKPVKLYTNKELAELYDLDFDYENILADYKKAGEAKVDYAKYVSDVAKNMTERQNTQNITNYLDAIRNDKAQAISKGMTSGARAASEVLATKEALQNKAASEQQTAQLRNQATADAFRENSQAALNATAVYNNLAKVLGNTSASLYANDTARYGADVSANANFYAADENLRSQRMAANQIMSAAYAAAAAQARASYDNPNNSSWYFNNILLPKNNGDVDLSVREMLDRIYTQNTGWDSPMTRGAYIYDNAKQRY